MANKDWIYKGDEMTIYEKVIIYIIGLIIIFILIKLNKWFWS